jgi:hypothetical protein
VILTNDCCCIVCPSFLLHLSIFYILLRSNLPSPNLILFSHSDDTCRPFMNTALRDESHDDLFAICIMFCSHLLLLHAPCRDWPHANQSRTDKGAQHIPGIQALSPATPPSYFSRPKGKKKMLKRCVNRVRDIPLCCIQKSPCK